MNNPQQNRTICFVASCQSSPSQHPEKYFFAVPENPKKRKTWLHAASMKYLKSTPLEIYFCEDHFSLREHLKNFYSFWLDGKKPIMKSSAVPNKFGDAGVTRGITIPQTADHHSLVTGDVGDIMFLDNSQQPATPFHDSQNQEQDKAKQAQQPSSMPAENYSHVASQSANLNDSGYPTQEIETSAMVPAASIVAQVMPLKVIIWSTEVTNVPNAPLPLKPIFQCKDQRETIYNDCVTSAIQVQPLRKRFPQAILKLFQSQATQANAVEWNKSCSPIANQTADIYVSPVKKLQKTKDECSSKSTVTSSPTVAPENSDVSLAPDLEDSQSPCDGNEEIKISSLQEPYTEQFQVETEALEELFTSAIDIEENTVKLETGEVQLGCLHQNDAGEGELVKTEPFEEILTSEVAIEERAVDVEAVDPLDWPVDAAMTTSETPPVCRKRKKNNCDECGVKYKHTASMTWHNANCHGPDASIKVKKNVNNKHEYHCDFCPHFNSRDSYQITQHLRSIHKIDRFPLHCSYCYQGFIHAHSLKEHQRTGCSKAGHVQASILLPTRPTTVEIPPKRYIISKISNGTNYENELPSQETSTRHLTTIQPHENMKINVYVSETQRSPSDFSNGTDYRNTVASQATCTPPLTTIQHHEKKKTKTPRSGDQHSPSVSNDSTYQSAMANQIVSTGLPAPSFDNAQTSSKLLKCEQCYKVFETAEILTYHIENCHETDAIIKVWKIGDNEKLFQCTFCKTMFKELPQLISHLRKQHRVEKIPYPCNSCDSKFILKTDLLKHRIHCKKDKIFCSDPDAADIKNAQQKSEVQAVKLQEPDKNKLDCVHQSADVEAPLKLAECRVLVHKLLECEMCSFYTEDRSELATHMQDHQAPNTPDCSRNSVVKLSLQCSQCGIIFSNREMFEWHIVNCHGSDAIIRVLKVGPCHHIYLCLSCPTVCRQLDQMVHHVHFQHDVSHLPFQCSKCGKQCMRRDLLDNHQCT